VIPRLRIFLSSPGDVAAAREIAAQTIEKLAQDYARHFSSIEPYLWEHEAMLASGHFQDSIELPSAFDIVVLILWSRLGTLLPVKTAVREYRGIDGRAPVTGTEWEFEEALERVRREGTPDLMVYRSLNPVAVDSRDPLQRDHQLQQLQALDAFWSRHFGNQDVFLGAYTEFSSDVEFVTALERHLRKLIERRLAKNTLPGDGTLKVWGQAPFRGLEAYEFEHGPIYFGQDDAVGRAILQIAAGSRAGSPFLLVLGASGSGKSSLVKAGIVPKLFVPRRITGAAFLRRVIFRPSDVRIGEDLFDALARRLTTQISDGEGLAELISAEVSLADFAAHLRNASVEPAMPFRLALGALGSQARRDGRMLSHEAPRLMLVVDQLEELFTDERTSADQRARFVELLAGLARSGIVWIIATIRADFWHRVLETPLLVALSEGKGRLDLVLPTPAQLTQMIRRPAEAAGVGFEVHPSTNIPLNDVIAEEVAREPAALPLLSYLLDQLYRADILDARGDVLTFSTYRKLGGLVGAIAARAEEVITNCTSEERDALGSVLFSLVQMGADEADVERAVARQAPLSAFPPGTPQRRLVDALLESDARLLVSDAVGSEGATVRVAHEALITHWPRAHDFVLANAAALKTRRRLEERYALWRGLNFDLVGAGATRRVLGRLLPWRSRAGHEKGLLSEIDLADGRRLLADHRTEIEPHLADYISRSSADEQRARTRSFRVLAGVAAIVTVLAIAASVAGWVATGKQHEAEDQASRALTETAAERLERGDVAGAEGISLEVLTRRLPDASRTAATNVFLEARGADTQVAVLSGHQRAVLSAAYSPDGRRIVTASGDQTARVWDAVTGVQLAVLSGHRATVASASYSPDGRRIVTASADKTARIWDAVTGAQLSVLSGHGAAVASAAYSPDGRRIVTASADKTARVWDAATGSQLAVLSGHEGGLTSASYSPDGRRIVTASTDKTARIWDAATGAQLTVISGHFRAVLSAAYSPDGRRIVTASGDQAARVWDAATGAQLAELSGHRDYVDSAAWSPDGQRIITASGDQTTRIWDAATGAGLAVLSGHSGAVSSARYSPDGRTIVTASFDKTVRIWDAAPSAQLVVFSGHDGFANTAAFSPDGRRIVTASDRSARIWDAATGAQLAVLFGHNNIINCATFSPDGRHIVTASDDKTARIWDSATGAQLTVLSGDSDAVVCAAFSPDGRRIATASADKTARIWDAATGAQLAVLSGHRERVVDAEYSPDGRRIVTASDDKTARIWDAATGVQLAVLSGHSDSLWTAEYAPDGRRIVTASNDRTARIWDAATGSLIAVLSEHRDNVVSAIFSPDGRRIVTASYDKTARIWDAGSGAQLAVLSGHDGEVQDAEYSPDGRRIVTASRDETVRIWDARTVDLQSQISWARAAQFDPLSDKVRSSLGLPTASPAHEGVRPEEVRALGRLADREEMSAIEQPSTTTRDAVLLMAFEHYATAAARAQDAGWPDEAWQQWRYRRATLARLLARDGLMRQVADAFVRAILY
jgi:WD40 repeat protein